ncbi:MAG TPA: S8 family serine peptidase, partial [Thermoanaerobaculia bacterium]|nr:S8 family serine peptidase [Thermoanaerobaculia bacterium]
TLAAAPSPRLDTPAPVVLRMRSGATIEVPAQFPRPTRRFIVEFNGPPLLARSRNKIATEAASATYRQTFARFRGDLAGLRRGRIAAESDPVEHEYYRAFHGVSVTLDAASVEAVRRLPYVRKVHEDATVKAFASEDLARNARIGAERVWTEMNVRGDGIVVAVIDTGIDYMHPALGGGIGAGFKVRDGWDFVAEDEDPMDEHGHGTHVAGIIAGNDDEVRGVAPHATLLAYRVLNEHGEGNTGDILAAIEWTVDPDRNDDPADHADVANMSLGGYGDADSPLAKAVDQATLAGVVFALAAGNTPGERSIGSPAAARLGITVGASDSEDLLAVFSSRGPSSPGWDLKPEVVAPGVLIRSAKSGGGTLVASGTSMAAPHVAGAAALLLQLHPDWTPADVKAALVGSATPIVEHVMGQGGGRINVHSAATSGDAVSPAVVTFGQYGGKDAWTATRTVTVVNRIAAEQTYKASFTTPQNVTVTAEPAEFTLGAGASREVVLTAAISAEAGAALLSLAHGGRVTFTSSDHSVQVPWVAIDAARVVVTHEHLSTVMWTCDSGPTMSLPEFGFTHELLLPNSRCDLLVYASAGDGSRPELILRSPTIESDLEIALTTADSMHEVRLGGVDQNGRLVSSVGYSEATPYAAAYDLQFPEGSKFGGLSIGTFSADPLLMSDFREDFTLTVSEMLFDFPARSIYSIHHPPLHGVRASTTLSTLPSDLRHARVSVAPQPEGTTLHAMMMYAAEGLVFGGGMNASATLQDGWSGDLYIMPDADPDTWGGVALHTARQADRVWMDLNTPVFRAIGNEIVLSSEVPPSLAAHRVSLGGTLAVCESTFHPGTLVETQETAFTIYPSVVGPANELAFGAMLGFTYELRDASGTLLREGAVEPVRVHADFGSRGGYRATVRAKNGPQVELSFDTSLPDSNPPTLSSLRVTDKDGRIVSRVALGTPATLAFSVADVARTEQGRPYDTGDLRVTRASWRTGTAEWQQLPITV